MSSAVFGRVGESVGHGALLRGRRARGQSRFAALRQLALDLLDVHLLFGRDLVQVLVPVGERQLRPVPELQRKASLVCSIVHAQFSVGGYEINDTVQTVGRPNPLANHSLSSSCEKAKKILCVRRKKAIQPQQPTHNI